VALHARFLSFTQLHAYRHIQPQRSILTLNLTMPVYLAFNSGCGGRRIFESDKGKRRSFFCAHSRLIHQLQRLNLAILAITI
jgi:hypothetical protein